MEFLEELKSGKFNLIILIIVVVLLFHLYWIKDKDNMEPMAEVSGDIKEAVKQVYLADVEAIRNLSEVATKLQAGGLTVPGNLTTSGNSVTNANSDVNGSLTVKGNSTVNGNSTINGATTSGSIVSSGNLSVNGAKLFTATNNTIECAGRQHMSGPELLYLLHKNGVMIGKEWGGNGNLQVQGSLTVGGQDIRTIVPIIINFNGPDFDHSFYHRTFPIHNQTFTSILWQDGNGWDIFERLKTRFRNLGRDWRANVRHLEDFRRYTNITLSIPPGKSVKFYGWSGQFESFGPGFHQKILSFGPHLVWAGWDEFSNDVPNNIRLDNRSGL